MAVAGGCKRDKAPARRRRRPTPVAAAAPAGDARALYEKGKAALENKMPARPSTTSRSATTTAADPELRANAWLGLGAAYGELGDQTHASPPTSR